MEIQSQQPQPYEPPQTKGASFPKTCFNGFNTLCGVGILTVPYALSKGGWLSLLLLIFVALLCYYTGLLLQRCMKSDPLIKTYPDIGQVAFGWKGRVVISTFLYLEIFLTVVEFLIMEGDNLHKLFPNFDIFGKKIGGKQEFIILAALVILPTTWIKNLGFLAYFSACGAISSVILLLAVLWGGVFDGIGFHERGDLWNWSGIPTTVSLFTFCFLGHAIFPTICNSMEKKSQFPRVLLISFILSTISYGSMSVIGYLMFGKNLASQVTLNMPTKNVSSKIAIFTTLLIPITKYALFVAPIATTVEEMFSFQNSMIKSCLIRTCLVISTLVVALVVPFFGHVMAFIGAFVGVIMSILLPCLCYWKIVIGFRNFGGEWLMILMIVLSGAFVGVVGTCTALMNIIKEVRAK
ncbi:Amino acid transporter, transmembrane [Artemisia annua]|uniref:Amino acid transporter, transmembrane n=1 Tax=Artemisia annua TaxID=35608 RepID=A0A2U1N8Z8_ARTAN|nr:Amino acid transporter, transmembrane [Artemisia annua]